ncbi:transcription factor Sp3 isoform X1 [Lates japonicus]|uniref:Transcription factor Sp3 isoform X1 n=1 Tax=Lates japonicus TaxID=270547 RepID=A0AAD3R201_LATJO|nr:transcription factor Sp3 isoform X1 [Lates japonicus]
MTAPEQPMKPGDMAALDVDSSHSDFLQQEEGRGSQDSQPSPLDLLATTCTKVGSPSSEVDRGAAADVVSRHLC